MEQGQKMKWFKLNTIPKDGTTFIPLDIEGREKFQIWDNEERKFLQENTKFMTSQGEFTVTKFNSLRVLTDEEQKRYRRSLQFNHRVFINGERMFVSWPTSVEQQFLKLVDTIRTMKRNPTNFSYKILRTQPPTGFVQYSVVLGEEQPLSSFTKMLNLTDREQALIQKMNETETIRDKTIQDKINIIMTNGVSELRAKDLANIFF